MSKVMEPWELDKIIFEILPEISRTNGRRLFMPGDGRYQPKELKPYLGYDMWTSFLIIVEWFWLLTLARCQIIPEAEAEFLTYDNLVMLLSDISTSQQDLEEKGTEDKKGTNHDILALLNLIQVRLPSRWWHFGATSYDIICTAYTLSLRHTFSAVFWPKLKRIDEIWCQKIKEFADIVQMGRTHLQDALPVTIGLWLACLHNRYVRCAKNANFLAGEVPGKFSGAVGTSASQIALFGRKLENEMMCLLNLNAPDISTQITPPEASARFYFELLLLSGVLGNLGEDVRLLQSSAIGELISVSSTSSTMAHKIANPIAAENNCGMHVNITAEFMKVILTLISDLQRDLRWSSVMRSFSAIMVYGYQQLTTTERLLKSLAVNRDRCKENFARNAYLVMGELLQLALRREGYERSHELVNKSLVPEAIESRMSLDALMDLTAKTLPDSDLCRAWQAVAEGTKNLLAHPDNYLGDTIALAEREAKNKLN